MAARKDIQSRMEAKADKPSRVSIPPVSSSATPVSEELVPYSTRIPRDLKRRLSVWAAENETTSQQAVTDAIAAYLDSRA